MKRRLVAVTAALIALLSFASIVVAELPPSFCGPDERSAYRCGAILVILEGDTTDTIGDVIERVGGDPAVDVLQEFSGVRDLLDPDGVADDLSETAVYQVAVPIGQEHEMADTYSADPAVYAAAVDRETIGFVGPDTALSAPFSSPLLPFGATLVLMAGAIAARTARCSPKGIVQSPFEGMSSSRPAVKRRVMASLGGPDQEVERPWRSPERRSA